MKILVLASFVDRFGDYFIFVNQVPVDITPDKVSAAVSEAVSTIRGSRWMKTVVEQVSAEFN